MSTDYSQIFSKIRKYGIVGTCRKVGSRLRYYYENRWGIRPVFYSSLMKLLITSDSDRKRILGIWDFKTLPWSIGDPLIFMEILSVLKIKHSAENVDICIVYDRENPGGNRGMENLTSENCQDYSLEFLPLFSTCPYLGSVYQFNSRKEFYRFLKNNIERYDIFPPVAEHLGETYNFYGGAPGIKEIIEEFFNTNGYIPHLRIGERDLHYAYHLFINHLPEDAVPVTISLKLTSHDPVRNADPSIWLSFIDKCQIDFPEVIFVIVGQREEMEKIIVHYKKRSNVIFSKEFGTSVIEDLALIRASLIYMGTASGANTIAQFSDLPYLIFQFPEHTSNKYNLKPGENFTFATDKQKVFSALTPVTSELLYSEFKNLYTKIDKGALKEQALKQACKKDSHPTSRVYGEVSAQIPLEANSAKNLEENKIQHNGIWQGANLKDVRLIVYDFDGVFTDNRVILREDGVESVIVNRADGLAIGILKDWGIKQIIITKERNNVVEARANKLTLTVIKGVDDKKAILIDYCKDNDIPLDKVVYIGNDINDIEAMKCVGYPVCPQDAYKEVRDISKIILDVPGGAGVVRNLLKYF